MLGLHNQIGCWMGSLVEKDIRLYLIFGGLETMLYGQTGSLSRLPHQLGLQTVIHGWVESLAGLPAWALLRLCSATGQGFMVVSAVGQG